ncbi:MAG TPA: hypothetical protein VL728_06260 [Cyclobacteriaceae bacterium]|nr:hypothetical protein [Cyclobacteriaceae bacterium]
MDNTEIIFSELGGSFCRPFAEFKDQLSRVKAYIFDWDGVFNDGVKVGQVGSPFSEVDAMGTNMLRFGHWLKYKTLPAVAVITGEENPSAQFLAQREHYHAIYFKTANKLIAFDHFLKSNKLNADEVAFVFDDVLDLGVAEKCGLRFLVKHHGSPLFQNYSVKNQIADYVTSTGNHAVREVCELILGANGAFDEAIRKRSHFDEGYQKYLKERNEVETERFFLREGKVEAMS